jgi:uncharacterized membrane protein
VAILAGVPVALLVRQIDNERLRAGAIIALSLVIGFAVVALAGELSENIGFGFFDAVQAAAGAVVTLVVMTRFRIGAMR